MHVERMKAALDRAIELAGEVREWDEDSAGYAVYRAKDGHDYLDMGLWGRVGECGTAACFAGYLTLTPWFIEQGLLPLVNVSEFCNDVLSDQLKPTYQDLKGYPALEAFFETDVYTIDYIFGSYHSNDINDLVRRIQVTLSKYAGGDVLS